MTSLGGDAIGEKKRKAKVTAKKKIVLIGVMGCSASGKTTVANRLVELLESPLKPISLDDFFDEDMCHALGTKEDPRCIRVEMYAQLLCDIRERLSSDNVCPAVCLRDLKGAAAYIRSPPFETSAPATPLGTTSDVLSSSCGGHCREGLYRNAGAVAAKDSRADDRTIFIVCEGFLLFAYQAVCDLCDYFLMMDIDGETACLRRFLRLPRHNTPQSCTERIERMLRCRREHLLRADDTSGNMSLPALFAHILPNLYYVPPPPSVPGDYARFWLQQEYLHHPPPPMPAVVSDDCSTSSPYSWMEVGDLFYITHTLRRSRLAAGVDGGCAAATHFLSSLSSVDMDRESLLQQKYFEFRYWFFFEVLYYYHQLKATAEALVCRSERNKAAGNIFTTRIWRITSGAWVSDATFDKQLFYFVRHLRDNVNDVSSPEDHSGA